MHCELQWNVFGVEAAALGGEGLHLVKDSEMLMPAGTVACRAGGCVCVPQPECGGV